MSSWVPTMTRAFNFPKSVVFKVVVMLQPYFSGGGWGDILRRNKIPEAQTDWKKFRHASQGPGLCSPTLAEATSALWGNWSVSEIKRFWEKSTKQVENLKMRGYVRIIIEEPHVFIMLTITIKS